MAMKSHRAESESAKEARSKTEAGSRDGRYMWTWETLEVGTCRRPSERERRNCADLQRLGAIHRTAKFLMRLFLEDIFLLIPT